MRVLVSVVPAFGHLGALTTQLCDMRDAGHRVAVATAAGFGDRVRAAGFEHFAIGPEIGDVAAAWAGPRRQGETRWQHGTRMAAALAAPRVAGEMLDVIQTWEPDLVMHDLLEFGAAIAAARAKVPAVSHGVGLVPPDAVFAAADEQLRPLWRRHGLTPRPSATFVHGTHLSVVPQRLETSRRAASPSIRRVRPVSFAWPGAPPGERSQAFARAGAYVSFGTLEPDNSLIEHAVAACRSLGLSVVATVGPQGDPCPIGTVDGVHVARYAHQDRILPACEVVVCHGGSGTVFGALAHGRPLVIVPRRADHFLNADACVRIGVAKRVDVGRGPVGAPTSEAIARAVADVAGQASFAREAQRVAEDFACLRPARANTVLCERLAETGTRATDPLR